MILNENKLAALFSKQTRAGAVGEARAGKGGPGGGGRGGDGGHCPAGPSHPRPGPRPQQAWGLPQREPWLLGHKQPERPECRRRPSPSQGRNRCPGPLDTEMRQARVGTTSAPSSSSPRRIPGPRPASGHSQGRLSEGGGGPTPAALCPELFRPDHSRVQEWTGHPVGTQRAGLWRTSRQNERMSERMMGRVPL